jgi:hypothetical protein
VRPSTQRASLALSKVSVKSRIAAFENKSPTASTFGPSPPRPGNVNSVDHSFFLDPERQEDTSALVHTTRYFDVTHIDHSETKSPALPRSVQGHSVKGAPRSGLGFPSSVAPGSARRLNPKSGAVKSVPTLSTVIRKEYTPLRAPPEPPILSTAQVFQGPSPSTETELRPVTTSVLDSSELTEQPSTPRLGKSSLALPTRPKGVRGERPFSGTSRSQPRLQIPSFGRRLPSGSPIQRVEHNELPGPGPRPEDALARQNRFNSESRLSQVFHAESPERESLAPGLTEPPFDDNESRQVSLNAEIYFGIGRSSSTRRNRAATLRSLEGIEPVNEQAILFKRSRSFHDKELGHSTERFPRTALLPKSLESYHVTAAELEAKDLVEQKSTLEGTETDHTNVSSFGFRLHVAKQQGPETVEEAHHKSKPTLLPSLIPRPGYSSPPSTPELPEGEAQNYKFSVPTLEGASHSDFERPSRRQVLSPASPIRGPRDPVSTGSYHEPPFLGHHHQLLPLGPTRTWWPSVSGEQPSYLGTPDDHKVLPLESEFKLLRLRWQQEWEERNSPLSAKSSPESSPETSETLTPHPTEAGAQEPEGPGPKEIEEITPRITRSLIQHRLRLSDSESDSGSGIMDRLRPDSALAVSHHRREAMRLAKAQEASVVEKCRRSGASIPEYAFDELIGKGSFGRVYKW